MNWQGFCSENVSEKVDEFVKMENLPAGRMSSSPCTQSFMWTHKSAKNIHNGHA